MADDLNLFVSRFIKLIGLAKVAAVGALGWNFSARLLQCLLYKPVNYPLATNSGTWIHKNSIHKWIHYRNLSCDFWNHYHKFIWHVSLLDSISLIQTTKFLSIFSNEFISMKISMKIQNSFLFSVMDSYLFMNQYMWIQSL